MRKYNFNTSQEKQKGKKIYKPVSIINVVTSTSQTGFCFFDHTVHFLVFTFYHIEAMKLDHYMTHLLGF
jgi:hypothetical protein